MSPSASPPAAMKVYIVQRQSEVRQISSGYGIMLNKVDISYVDDAFMDEQQAFAAALREQIAELEESGSYSVNKVRKLATQAMKPLKERLMSVHQEVEESGYSHDRDLPVVKFCVLEFPVAPVKSFVEADFLKGLETDSEDNDEEEGEEEDDEQDVGDVSDNDEDEDDDEVEIPDSKKQKQGLQGSN